MKRFGVKQPPLIAFQATPPQLPWLEPRQNYNHLPMCDWHYNFETGQSECQGGTCQDETCLNCSVYVKGSNPRVEKFRK